jgi:FkbM family methyltransferase
MINKYNFQDFTYSKKRHFQLFEDFGILGDTDINSCNLKVYQDLLVYNFIIANFPKGSKLLEIAGDNSNIIKALMSDYECWNVGKFEEAGNDPSPTGNAQGYNLVVDYIGNFSSELPSNYFDFVFSISVLAHIPEDEKKLKSICGDINRVLRPGGLSLHCVDSLLRKNDLFILPSIKYIFCHVKTLNEEVSFRDIDREDGFFMSELAYNNFWKPTIKKNYDEFGVPFSYNVLWEKEVLTMGTDFQNANLLKNQGEFDKAKLLYRRAIKQDPSFAWYYYNLGEVLELQGNFEEAINAYQDAIKLNPASACFYHKLAHVNFLQGYLEKAVLSYQQAIKLEPNRSAFYNKLGDTLVRQGSLELATNYYQKVLEINPRTPSFQNFLGKVLPFKEHPTLSNACENNLIYDVGMHIGQDTEFYLKKGFNVIAVEANPVLVRDAQNKFSKYIKSQRLIILNVGIGSNEGTFPFYVNETLSEWSSFVEQIGSRGGKYNTILVKCIPLHKIIAKFGVPYYLKVDIEGHDFQCIESLRSCAIKPKYVSVENGNGGLLECLRELGYDRFKFINQSKVAVISCSYPALEGNFVDHNFDWGSSGPFGEETTGRWKSYDEVAADITNYWSTPNLNANVHGWFDLHAQLSDELQRIE